MADVPRRTTPPTPSTSSRPARPAIHIGSLRHPIVEEELALLENVRSRLEERAARGDHDRSAASERRIRAELERIREVMRSGEEDKDRSSLLEQWHHQSALLEQLRSSREGAPVDPDIPYFGHLRLREEGREWDLCLGRTSCVGGGLRIVDWRDAPIAKLFYSYRQGEDYEEEIAGREREGEIVTRRMVAIDRGTLKRIQAPEGDFRDDPERPGEWIHRELAAPRLAGGEAAALRAHETGATDARLGGDGTHGRSADRHLPEITGLIDPEQYGLISRPSSGFLIVRGTAGSGKTTVALHRVAFLAYDDPRIDGPDTLVVMFSQALQKYVSHVLPSLGLSRVEPQTYRKWERSLRERHFPRLPGGEREDTPGVVTRAKLHPLLAGALARHIERTHGPATGDQAIDDWASALTNRELLLEIRDEQETDAFTNNEIDRIIDWNRSHVGAVQDHLAGEDVDAALDAEDDALLLRAWQLRVGPLRGKGKRPLRYRHVVLDEVQDFSPLEVQILIDCLDPRGSITLAGDTQQHVVENSGFTSWADFMGHLGVEGHEVETLKINYRSSAQISKFAFDVLGDLREDDERPTSARQGPPVETFHFTDTGACVFFLSEALEALAESEPMATVALITPSPEISAQYHAALQRSEIPRLRLVRDYDFSFKPGIEITELEPVKGLEFDYVVILDANSVHWPNTPAARRSLHVAATRAIHQLWVISTDTPSPLLPAQ